MARTLVEENFEALRNRIPAFQIEATPQSIISSDSKPKLAYTRDIQTEITNRQSTKDGNHYLVGQHIEQREVSKLVVSVA